MTATTVRLEWSYKGPEDLQYYVLQHKPKNANQVKEKPVNHRRIAPANNKIFLICLQAYSETSGIITMFYVVRVLSPYTEYEFHVIGVNNIGRGPASAAVSTTTGETGLNENWILSCLWRVIWWIKIGFWVKIEHMMVLDLG